MKNIFLSLIIFSHTLYSQDRDSINSRTYSYATQWCKCFKAIRHDFSYYYKTDDPYNCKELNLDYINVMNNFQYTDKQIDTILDIFISKNKNIYKDPNDISIFWDFKYTNYNAKRFNPIIFDSFFRNKTITPYHFAAIGYLNMKSKDIVKLYKTYFDSEDTILRESAKFALYNLGIYKPKEIPLNYVKSKILYKEQETNDQQYYNTYRYLSYFYKSLAKKQDSMEVVHLIRSFRSHNYYRYQLDSVMDLILNHAKIDKKQFYDLFIDPLPSRFSGIRQPFKLGMEYGIDYDEIDYGKYGDVVYKNYLKNAHLDTLEYLLIGKFKVKALYDTLLAHKNDENLVRRKFVHKAFVRAGLMARSDVPDYMIFLPYDELYMRNDSALQEVLVNIKKELYTHPHKFHLYRENTLDHVFYFLQNSNFTQSFYQCECDLHFTKY